MAADAIEKINGNGAKAIALVVYGNRDYDDALLELADILASQGFRVIAAGAFIGEHSIFPKVGTSRPDASDMEKLAEFGQKSRMVLESGVVPSLKIKGNRPYKKYGGVPLQPKGDKSTCISCGRCVELCPTEAIDYAEPWLTDANWCISCGRCIYACRQSARTYGGLKYSVIGTIFKAAFSKRKEPEMIL